jgi:hypothetical protein
LEVNPAEPAMMEIAKYTKSGELLTKRIWLDGDTLRSSGAECRMSQGAACRVEIADVDALAAVIEKLDQNQAIGLGRLRSDLPDKVKILSKAKLNGVARRDIVARTHLNIIFEDGEPALALLDFDTKGMPQSVADKLKQLGGFWMALVSVVPELANVARVTRSSTSSGLYRSDTGAKLPGSDGIHEYIVIADSGDAERFLRVLHDKTWLAGLGWMMVGAGGQLLERSIVDRMVGAAERLIFEAPPNLKPPLKQDRKARRPVAMGGDTLNTIATCPPLSLVQQSNLEDLKAREAQRLAPEARKAREAFIDKQAEALVKRTGVSKAAAAATVARQCDGVLLPDVELPFDDEGLAGSTVADVLADPAKFEGATLADPLEGLEYGSGKAKVLRRADGSPLIHSFAHGRMVYALRYDAAAVRKAMQAADKADVVKTFVAMAMIAEIDVVELEDLRQLGAKLSGKGVRLIDAALQAAREQQAARQAKEARKRAPRSDPRPGIEVPLPDAPWLLQMDVLNEVVGKVTATRPPTRDIDGVTTQARRLPVPDMHSFTEANEEETDDE